VGGWRFAGTGLLLAVLVLSGTASAAPSGDPPPDVAADDPTPAPASVPFSPNVRVNSGNPTYAYQVEPTMAINSQGRIFVGWKEAFTHNGGGQRVSFSYSTDEGASWAPNVLMPLHTYRMQSDPWITVAANDRVFFSRIEYNGTSVPGGIAITETIDGVTWGPNLLLDDAPRFADKQTHANDAAGNVYMVWNSDLVASGDYQLEFSRSDDGGATWSPHVLVPDDGNGHLGGFVQVHPDRTVLVTWWSWITRNVWFDRSTDGGATWGADVRVNDMAGSADSPLNSDPPVLPAMAVAPNGTIYVVWNDYRNGRPGGVPNGDFDIMFSRSDDGGSTWSPTRRLNDDATTNRQWMPDLALDPFGGIHAAWMDDRNGGHDVYYVNSTDGGTTWGPNVRVTDTSTPLSFTRPGDYLAIESDRNGHVYVAWTDGRSADLDIYLAKLERTATYAVDTVYGATFGGLTVEVDGIPYVAPATFSWPVGSTHTVAVPTLQYASPQARFVFWNWAGGAAQNHTVTMNRFGLSELAMFLVEYEVTVRTQPPSLEVLVDDVPSLGETTRWWQSGSGHWLNVSEPQAGPPGVRYLFDYWNDGAPNPRFVMVGGPVTHEVTFRPQYRLEVESSYGSATGAGWYNASEAAAFSVPATIPSGFGTRLAFAGWSGDSTAGTPGATIIMDGPKRVTATWRTEHLLTIVSTYGNPVGAGWHAEGSEVSVQIEETVVVDGTTYRFVGWTGDATGTNATIAVTMDAPKTLTAAWEEVGPRPPSPATPWPWIALLLVLFLVIVLAIWRRRRKRDEVPPAPPPAT